MHWLIANEDEANAQLGSKKAAEPAQTQSHTTAPSLTAAGAGVAGILRREAQLAAQNDE